MSARDTALSTLIACRRAGAWSDGALKQNLARDGLDRRDAALATRLCFGVLQNRMLIDFWLSRFVRGSLEKLQPVVLDILRLAVCQLAFADKIPPSAAVSEAVNQTRRCANARAAGLVNGVLRAMLRDRRRLALPEDLSIRYSHPQALVELLRENVGAEKLEPLLAAHNGSPPTYLQVNTRRADARTVTASLEAEGFSVDAAPVAGKLPDPDRRVAGAPPPSATGCSTCRTPPPAWRSWPPIPSPAWRSWTAAPPPAERALPPGSKCRTGASSAPAICTRIKSTSLPAAPRGSAWTASGHPGRTPLCRTRTGSAASIS